MKLLNLYATALLCGSPLFVPLVDDLIIGLRTICCTLYQLLHLGLTIVVDVQTVGLIIDDVGICAESIKDRFGEIPGASIRTIQTDIDTLEGEDAQRDLPYSPYRESYIQKKIWETCFSQNQLEMNQ